MDRPNRSPPRQLPSPPEEHDSNPLARSSRSPSPTQPTRGRPPPLAIDSTSTSNWRMYRVEGDRVEAAESLSTSREGVENRSLNSTVSSEWARLGPEERERRRRTEGGTGESNLGTERSVEEAGDGDVAMVEEEEELRASTPGSTSTERKSDGKD